MRPCYLCVAMPARAQISSFFPFPLLTRRGPRQPLSLIVLLHIDSLLLPLHNKREPGPVGMSPLSQFFPSLSAGINCQPVITGVCLQSAGACPRQGSAFYVFPYAHQLPDPYIFVYSALTGYISIFLATAGTLRYPGPRHL